MGCATPAKVLSINNDLTDEIIDFLKFKSGRAFEQDPSVTKDDWTKMIWDIINATKAKASKRKNLGLGSFPRQTINYFDGCCSFTTNTSSIFQDLHEELEFSHINIEKNGTNFFDEENISPSVILIESREEGEG